MKLGLETFAGPSSVASVYEPRILKKRLILNTIMFHYFKNYYNYFIVNYYYKSVLKT